MRITIIGVTNTTKEEVRDFFNGLQERGYIYGLTWSEHGELFDMMFDMNDLVILKVLDGVEFYRKTQKGDSYYIDQDDFIEIKLS